MSRLFPLTVLLFAALAALALAGERQYAEDNCAITPPDDWEDATAIAGQKGVIACFRAPDHRRSVFVIVDDRPKPLPEMDNSFADEFDRAAEPQMGKRISGRFIPVQGLRCYERTSAPVVNGKTISMVARIILVRSRFYSIQGYHFAGGDAGTDPLIQQVIESFHFLTPPSGAGFSSPVELAPGPGAPAQPPGTSAVPAMRGSLPAPPVNVYITSTDPPPVPAIHSAPPAADTPGDSRAKDLQQAILRGQDVGRMLVYVAAIGVPILVIVWFARRRKRGPASTRPPRAGAPPQRPAAPKAPPPPAPTATPASRRPDLAPDVAQTAPAASISQWEPPAAPVPPVPPSPEPVAPMPDLIVASQVTPPDELPVAELEPPASIAPPQVELVLPPASPEDAGTLAAEETIALPAAIAEPQVSPPSPPVQPETLPIESTLPPPVQQEAPPAEPALPPVPDTPVAAEPVPSSEPAPAPESQKPPSETPAAEPEPPVEPPPAPPAPPPEPAKAPKPEKFVIRPRQKHMRQ